MRHLQITLQPHPVKVGKVSVPIAIQAHCPGTEERQALFVEIVPGGGNEPGSLIDRMMPFDDYLRDDSVKQLRAAAYHHVERLRI